MTRDLQLIEELQQEIGTEIEVVRDKDIQYSEDPVSEFLDTYLEEVNLMGVAQFSRHVEMADDSKLAVINENADVIQLYLHKLELETIPPPVLETVFELKNIEVLSLYDNPLSSGISPRIKQLKNLKLLFLDFSELAELPREIIKLPRLQHLSLKTAK